MSGAQPRRTVRVVAGNDGSTTHIARFSTPPGPNLTRPDIAVTMARDDKAIMRRVRAGAKEATRPWLLTAPHPVRAPEPLTYVGTLEESQCNRYVLLVPHEGGFRTVPCHEWYSFVPRPAKVAAMKRADHERTMREAEERMRARHNQSDLYLERKTGAEKGDGDDDRVDDALRISGDGAGDGDAEMRAGGGSPDDEPMGGGDVYEGGGEEAAAWMNAGLEKDLGEDVDKGEELDMDDNVSDDEGDDGRLGEDGDGESEDEDEDEEAEPFAPPGAQAAAGPAPLADAYQRIDEREDDESDAGDDEAPDNGEAAQPGATGASASGAGKRERVEGAAALHAAGSAALAMPKRPRVAQRFLQESDIVQMLRSWAQPPTVEEFMVRLNDDLRSDPSLATDGFRDFVFATLGKVAMQIMYNQRPVLVLRDEFKK